jgi:tellurite methyltransferase
MRSAALQHQLGPIDIYLFDQILRGRFDDARRILDAGCGSGRNLVWFLREGFDVFAIDEDPRAVAETRQLAARLAPAHPASNIVAGGLDVLPWDDAVMDAVICSAVLHFAHDADHFGRMVSEAWRVLAPGGLFFARLASSIGLEPVLASDQGRMRLPDGSDRFVVSERFLREWTVRLGGELLDPLKTTNVDRLRAMTTWVLRKDR